ncbi:uncharacterized protein LOC130764942 [Actinidia eriantha]|uniref:uncharacterized protein LOC130764942 n=1 Tax=Actinidia eriantha TaxID=165200 RepID=UPI0025856F17|nr:uncharacterized protein LOC130764942 [Actinidia eriantha]
MGLVSRPDSANDGAENGTVPQLISLLKSAFQPVDFDHVQKILTAREEDMQREIAHWKNQFESMEKKNSEKALAKLEVENELNKYKRECGVLREQVTRLEQDLRVQIARSEEDQRVQITRSREDLRVHCDREKTREQTYAKLLEDYTKIETENKKLNFRVSDLDIGRNKAERELQMYKKRFEELNLRVSRMEGDTAMLMSGGQKRKEDSVGDEMVVENKTSESGKSQCETNSVGTGDANAQVKESTSKRDVVGSASDPMEAGSNGQEAATSDGTGDANAQEKESTSKGNEVVSASDPMEAGSNGQEAGPHSVMACNNGKPIQIQSAVERGISNKVTVTSAAGDGRAGSSFVIEISDSDDENPKIDGSTTLPNFAASNKEIKSELSGLASDENGKSGVEDCLLASTTKRKRGSNANVYESENDDDHNEDDVNPSKRQTKSLQELIMDGTDVSDTSDSEDSSSSDSDSEYERMIEILRKTNGDRKTWAFKADMISDFERDPELCMNAVCALYRHQSCKVKSVTSCLLSKNRGFNQFDALRGTTLANILLMGIQKVN